MTSLADAEPQPDWEASYRKVYERAELLADSEQQKAEELARAIARAQASERECEKRDAALERAVARAEAAERMLVEEREGRMMATEACAARGATQLGPEWFFAFQRQGGHDHVRVRRGPVGDGAFLGTLVLSPDESEQFQSALMQLGVRAVRYEVNDVPLLPSTGQMVENLRLALSPSEPKAPSEAQKRDEALALLERTRASLIARARAVAEELDAARPGGVTSTQVLALLRNQGHGPMLDSVDRRFMGAVFRRGWEQVGWAPSGSHKRLVPVWRRRDGKTLAEVFREPEDAP